MAPDFLAGFRIDGPQHADVVFVQRLDGEAGAEERRAFLVGDAFVPDVHAPFVGRHIEQPGVFVVGHRHPVFRAEERRRYEDRAALGFGTRGTGTAGFVVDRPAVLIQAGGPGDLVHEREATDEFAVGAVQHVEETVTVGSGCRLDFLAAFAVVERHQLVHAVVVPTVVRRALEVPLDGAVVRVERQAR
ncbi:hypothetical protein D3C85_947050 [compost metagenome]